MNAGDEDEYESSDRPEQTEFVFRGPANWFELRHPAEIRLTQNQSFIEVCPVPDPQRRTTPKNAPAVPPWTMTLYAAWVDSESSDDRETSDDSETAADADRRPLEQLARRRSSSASRESEQSFEEHGVSVESLFRDVVRSQRESFTHSQADSAALFAGESRVRRRSAWWRRLLKPAPHYEWRLWILQYREITVVAGLQSAAGQPLEAAALRSAEELVSSIRFADPLAVPPEVFRRRVVELASSRFPLLEVQPEGSFSVRVGESQVNLSNFYRSYLQAPAQLEQIVIPGITAVVRLQEWGPDQVMPPLDEVRDRVMPMLYPQDQTTTDLEGFVAIPWVGGLSVMFVIDEGETYRFVHQRMLEVWDLDAQEVHELALENLHDYAEEHPIQVTVLGSENDPQMLIPSQADAYNSVRVLHRPFHARLRELFGPELLVGVPNRDCFVVTSLKHPELIHQVRRQVQADFESMHHPLTSRLLVISADGVSEYCEADD